MVTALDLDRAERDDLEPLDLSPPSLPASKAEAIRRATATAVGHLDEARKFHASATSDAAKRESLRAIGVPEDKVRRMLADRRRTLDHEVRCHSNAADRIAWAAEEIARIAKDELHVANVGPADEGSLMP